MHAPLLTLFLALTQTETPPPDVDLSVFGDDPTPTAVEPAAADEGEPTALAPLPADLVASLQTGSGGDWSASAGESIRDALSRWTQDAGWELVWAANHDRDIVLDVDVSFAPGTSMQEAIRATFKALSRRPLALKACEYQNKTIRVVHLGDRCE